MTPAPERDWTGRRRGGRLGNQFFVLLVRHGGLFLAPFFLVGVCLYFLIAAPGARRASFDLADRVGRGGSRWRRLRFAYGHFYQFAWIMLDRMALVEGQADRYRFTSRGHDLIQEAAEEERGVILLTAHVGNWEAMGQLSEPIIGRGMTLIMYDGVQPELRRTMERMAAGQEFKVVYVDDSPTSSVVILEALRRGEIVGMMGDRVLAGDSLEVPFLGGSARFPTGPHAIAAVAQVPVIHAFAVRERRGEYSFHGTRVEPPSGSRRQRAARLRECVAAFAVSLEEVVREYPQQWGNFYPFWSDGESEDAEDGGGQDGGGSDTRQASAMA